MASAFKVIDYLIIVKNGTVKKISFFSCELIIFYKF